MRKIKETLGCGSLWGWIRARLPAVAPSAKPPFIGILQKAAAAGLNWPLPTA
ncbi:MAG TPA: hypothetical protein VML19_09975 [Verrucomicrobiae bacterium]|nr:hypothetical protein [Verrucomicrobiae bacterium]